MDWTGVSGHAGAAAELAGIERSHAFGPLSQRSKAAFTAGELNRTGVNCTKLIQLPDAVQCPPPRRAGGGMSMYPL